MKKVILSNLIIVLTLHVCASFSINQHIWQLRALNSPSLHIANRMSQFDDRSSQKRALPEGHSFAVPAETNVQIRINGLERELEQAQRDLAEKTRELERVKSISRQEETRNLQEQQRLTSENERMRNELLKGKKLEESSPSSLDGTPQLEFELDHPHQLDIQQSVEPSGSSASSDSPQAKFIQTLVPRLKGYIHIINDLTRRVKEQKETIKVLVRQFDTMQPKGSQDLHRRNLALASSMDTSYSAGGPPTGLSTSNLNLTLSLASSNQPKFPTRGHEGRSNPGSDSVLDSSYQYRPETMDRPSNIRTGSPRRLGHNRQDPVESSDHIYTNEHYKRNNPAPHTFSVNETAQSSSEGYYSAAKKSIRTPVPVPRPRTTKSMSASMTSIPVSEGAPNIADSYEIVDKQMTIVPSHRRQPLGMVPEASDSNYTTNHPTVLTQHLTIAPEHDSVASGGSERRRVNQICDVCHNEFPEHEYSRRQFMDHCIECAEQATDDEHTDGPITFSSRIATESRTCCVCTKVFSEEILQADFENHVHSHFTEDWENVPRP